MRVGIAADHGGLSLKLELAQWLRDAGHEAVDFGANELCSEDDYPDFVLPLAEALAAGRIERGVAVCGSGVGASIAANKVAGVRAALIHDVFSAHQGVEDDDMNIVCLGGRVIGPSLAMEVVTAFLGARFTHAERHLRRLGKVLEQERRTGASAGRGAEVEIYDDVDAVSAAAARLFLAEAQKAVALRGRFCVALSGGETPRRTFELLAKPPYRDSVPWPQVHVFWGDERCVGPDDPRSNYRMARLALLEQVPIPTSQVHPIDGSVDHATGAQRYDALLSAQFPEGVRFDLVMLGLGEDGHTASLFPGVAALDEQRQLAAGVPAPVPGPDRVTLTAAALNTARTAAFLAAGAAKAEVLQAVLEGPKTPARLPSQLIRPTRGGLLWLVDRAAARAVEHLAAEPHSSANHYNLMLNPS
ncbi:6-phosphogluconolactonase [Pirellulimonas nuda]|uniref:6-phosphogluconolactonase n=1 Tax=Pirellulimonas nuda TaxID=2528009 RepID=A0A518D8V1_9BACT|nr:6-phosphogluconolactonase [Pirellulimonas nuda]QDU87906.1 6-phosphogluconolactonase [Pirellulimonas nuda]